MAASDPTELARHALEQVCSGSDASAAVGVYSPDFHDHLNAREYYGHDGIRQSLGAYQLVFSDGDLRIRVEDQVGEGDRVASRWVAEGPQPRPGDQDLGNRDQPHRRRRDRRGLGRLGQPGPHPPARSVAHGAARRCLAAKLARLTA